MTITVECKHSNTDWQLLTSYDGASQYPPQIRPRNFLVCLDCKARLREYPPRVGSQLFKGKGTNDKRRMKGDMIGE